MGLLPEEENEIEGVSHTAEAQLGLKLPLLAKCLLTRKWSRGSDRPRRQQQKLADLLWTDATGFSPLGLMASCHVMFCFD